MRTVVRSATLIAFSVACGYAKLLLFPYLFFVELFTMAVFLSGSLVGVAWGAWVGGVSRLVFSVANPLGPPHPWILAAQVAGSALVGAMGGLTGPLLLRAPGGPPRRRTWLLVLCAAAATLSYDLLTNLAQGLVFGSVPAALALGAIPAAQHLGSNIAIFVVVGNLAFPWLGRHLAVALALAWLASPCSAAAPAAPDSTAAAAPGPVAPAAPDSLGGVPGVPGDTVRVPVPSAVDFDAQRKRGEISFDAALLGRRTALFLPLPLYGAAQGFLSAPDAGTPVRPDRPGVVADAATDRTVVDTGPYGLGVPDLSVAFTDPRGDNVDPIDLISLSAGLEPGPLGRAGELLDEPEGRWASSGAMPDGSPKLTRAKSALYYGNGDAGEKEAGVRFVMPSLGEGVWATYARHEADGTYPLNHALSTRYAGGIGLPRLLSHSFWLEGKTMDRDIEADILRVDPLTSAFTILIGSAQTYAADLSLHGRAAGSEWESRWLLRTGQAKRTQVDPDSGRVEWDFPEWGFDWQGTKRGPVWTGTAYVAAASRHIEYHGPETEFDVRRAAARVGVGLRRALGAGSGLGIDVAPDFRETEPALLNARLSYWRENPHLSARVDLETAHERPSWVDLLTPARVISAPRIDYAGALGLYASGDPTLSARRLDGGMAAATYRASKSFTLAATGSLRHVENDFGWNLYGVVIADTLYLANVAQQRGDGWTSHGALSAELRARWLAVRALAWARGGPADLTPRSGSPPRYGGEGAADFRAVLFRGDVAFTLGLRGRASGPRTGTLDLPGQASWDAAIRADFGQAAAFIEWMNVFDSRVASAMVGLYGDGSVLMPGTAFHFGFVWYLFD